ncbi:MAG TPA: hypothetical protein VFN13_07060 [Rudaea sp.]|nr:hypothetical protein [Rudaea sp.]
MQSQSDEGVYELHWMRHADCYLALVREAVMNDPADLELRELLHAMQTALLERKRKLH